MNINYTLIGGLLLILSMIVAAIFEHKAKKLLTEAQMLIVSEERKAIGKFVLLGLALFVAAYIALAKVFRVEPILLTLLLVTFLASMMLANYHILRTLQRLDLPKSFLSFQKSVFIVRVAGQLALAAAFLLRHLQ